MSIAHACACCGRRLHLRTHPPGTAKHNARGLCETCYSWARDSGTLHEYPRLTRSSRDTLDAWNSLRALGVSRKDAARVVGMSYAALSRAIARGARG